MASGNSIQSPQEFGNASASVDANDAGITIPEKDDSGDSNAIDPATLENNAGSGSGSGPEKSGPRKRGRPPGNKPRSATQRSPEKTASSAPLDIASLNTLIYNGHLLLAKVSKIPELELDEAEAKKISDATANLAKHYNIAVSQKTLDWTNFVTALSGVYGPRIFVIASRKRAEKMGDVKQPPTEAHQPQPIITDPPSNPYAAAAASMRAVHGTA